MASVASLGLGQTMEQKLHSVGIHSAEELIELGSRQAVFRLKERYPNTCVVILYYLEAAIRGVEIKQLSGPMQGGIESLFHSIRMKRSRQALQAFSFKLF
ncbi:MAG: TfoX/Sxy family protein [Clostridiales bacterium]|nr:TfoX/Sxy family protein [Clostridiales bacterium]